MPANKPIQGTLLDRARPQTEGLVTFWAVNEGGGPVLTDLAGPAHVDLVNAPAWSSTADGLVLALVAASAPSGNLRRPIPIPSGSDWSFSWACNYLGGGAGYILTSSSDTYDKIWLRDNADSVLFTLDDYSSVTWTVTAANQVGYHRWTITRSGSTFTLYRDGASAGTQTSTSPFSWGGGGRADRLFNFTGTAYFGGTFAWGMAHARALPAGEVAALHADPFAVLAPPDPLRFAAGAAAPAATTYTLTTAGTGTAGVAQAVTVTLDAAAAASLVITLASSGGTFDDATVEVLAGQAGPFTRQFTPSAAGTATITGTNDAGLTDPAPASVTVGGAPSGATIDAGWLAANAAAFGGPPYALGVAFGSGTYGVPSDGVYTLATDVTTPGTAFIVSGANVTLELAGHTVTYNDATPPTVANGDFTADAVGSSSLTGWTYTPASGVTVAVDDGANAFLPGTGLRVVAVSGLSTAGTATLAFSQGAIAMPAGLVGHTVAARVAMSVLGGTSALNGLADVVMKVYDDATDTLLATGTDGQGTTSGTYDNFKCDGSVAVWTPANTNNIRIEVTVQARGTAASTIYFGRVRCGPCYDYGIVASNEFTIPGTDNWPAAMRFAGAQGYNLCNTPTVRDTPGTGAIRQGAGNGYTCNSFLGWTLQSPLVLHNVRFFPTGDDSAGISLLCPGTAPTTATKSVTDCAVVYPTAAAGGVDVLNRAYALSAIELSSVPGDSAITGCTLQNCPQVGIGIGRTIAGTTHLIDGNTITMAGVVSNSYALNFLNPRGLTCTNNTVSGVGEGLLIDSLFSEDIADCEFGHNAVAVALSGSRENGSVLQSRAFRMRNNAGPSDVGSFVNLSVHDNTFTSTSAGPDSIGGWITIADFAGTTPHTNLLFAANAWKGTNDAAGGGLAIGLCLDGVAAGVGVAFSGDTFESNESSIYTSLSSGFETSTSDCLFLGCTFAKSADGDPTRTYHPILQNSNDSTGFRLIDAVYAGGAAAGVALTGFVTGTISYEEGYVLTPTVNSGGTPLAGAALALTDADSADALASPLAATITDDFGHPAVSYGGAAIGGGIPVSVARRTSTGGGAFASHTLTPHTLSASKSGYTAASTPVTLAADAPETLDLAASTAPTVFPASTVMLL